MNKYKTFVVEIWARFFQILSWISLFWVIRRLFLRGKDIPIFPEVWVLSNLALSIVLLSIPSSQDISFLMLIGIYYGIARVFEVSVYQVNVMFFDEYRSLKRGSKTYGIHGFRRLVILLLHNYIEIILWFALFYRNTGWAFDTGHTTLNSFLESIKFSFVTMSSFGYSSVSPKTSLGDILANAQAGIGLFMTLLIISRFVSLMPNPKTLDESECNPNA